MRQQTKCVAVLCAAWFLTASSPASAQMLRWEDKGYLGVNVGGQTLSRSFTETSTPVIYNENALFTVPHTVGSGLLFDVSGGMRVWRNLAIGLGFSSFSDSESPTVTAQIPNPIAFGLLRPASGSAGELSHSETAVHLQFVWMVPMSDKIELAAVLGPSFFRIKQDFIGDVVPVEGPPPFTTVSLGAVTTREESKSAAGVNIGIDGTYLLTKRIGAGMFLRWAGASADLATSGGGTVTVDAGGFQVGGGLRYRF